MAATEEEFKKAIALLSANYWTVIRNPRREGDELVVDMKEGEGGVTLPEEIMGIKLRRLDPKEPKPEQPVTPRAGARGTRE